MDFGGERQVFLLTDGEAGFDGIEGRDGGEDRGGADQVADLNAGDAGDAVYERPDLGEAEI